MTGRWGNKTVTNKISYYHPVNNRQACRNAFQFILSSRTGRETPEN